MDRLSAMEAGLHDFLTAGGNAPPTDANAADGAPVIRPLTAGPAEPPKAPDQPKEDKSYGGTFYPTVAHGKHKKPENDAGVPKGD
jgi:hypothetical protein